MLNEIFFLVFSFLTVFLSIKLSYYADNLSKTSNISKAFIGGLLLAGITSLPEFITCFSAIIFDNPALAVGDILGSNLFNIFMICFLDIYFLKKMFMTKTSSNHFVVYLFLIINYIFIYLFVKNIFDFQLFNIGIPSLVIIFIYIIYIKFISLNDEIDYSNDVVPIKNVLFKLIITSICMIASSVLLTTTVNNIAINHPYFSGSVIGAILLGITTSLPEVITFYTLISIDNYDMALSNIIGSNLFNLLVLSFGDLILSNRVIYSYFDNETCIILILGIIFTFFNMLQNLRSRSFNKFTYIFISILIIVAYISFWILGFI